MNGQYNKIGIFSGSTLKIIACIFMTIDHVGLVFFPQHEIFRILGRLAFPMFAFFIAEGSRYSKHKIKRFLSIFSIGIAFFVFYYFYDGKLYGNIFLTFSISILLDSLLTLCKKALFSDKSILKSSLFILSFVISLLLLYNLYSIVDFEYRFSGMLLPVIVNLTNFKNINNTLASTKLDSHWVRMFFLAIGCILMSINGNLGVIQYYCLLAVPVLALYDGSIGNKKLKYIFYLYYPTHLVIIEGLALIISIANK